MPDVHLPQLDEHEEDTSSSAVAGPHRSRTKAILKIVLEVLLISTSVFLGIAGEQWRESMRRRELAEMSLRRLKAEVQANTAAVNRVKDYHSTLEKKLEAYLANPSKQGLQELRFRGLQPAGFNHTAWDLAISTQALADIDPELAFALARVYNVQAEYGDLSRGILQSMYNHPPDAGDENMKQFLTAVNIYYADIVRLEPELLRQYEKLLPQISRALGDTAAEDK